VLVFERGEQLCQSQGMQPLVRDELMGDVRNGEGLQRWSGEGGKGWG
jgi:hypothetical protein